MTIDPSPRLVEALQLVVKGYSDDVIAVMLTVKVGTVKEYVRRLKRLYFCDPRFRRRDLYSGRVLLALLGSEYLTSIGKAVDFHNVDGEIDEARLTAKIALNKTLPSKNGKKKQPVSSSRFVSRSSASDGANGQRAGRRKAS